MRILFLICSVLLSNIVIADSGEHPVPSIPKEFETMKQFLGTWEGVKEMEGKKMPMTVTYELTSGGTAITEKLMVGTPQEMVSVYHKDGDSVAMTHYCSLGNQPHMELTSASDNEVSFAMKKTAGIQSKKEPHMRAVTLTLKNKNTLQQQWAFYKDGKQASIETFELQRK